jgi:hypothetical protein
MPSSTAMMVLYGCIQRLWMMEFVIVLTAQMS